MTASWVAVAALAFLLAYANGSNDISKGIATLVGSGVSRFRGAVLWGTLWTTMGGMLAALVSQGLVATFSGSGFLDHPTNGPAFLAAVAAGAAAWVLFASATGLPVSTTHAIAGALAGSAIVAQGASVLHWGGFASRVALPLGLSPVVAIALMYASHPLLSLGVRRVEAYCLCLERRAVVSGFAADGRLVLRGAISEAVVAAGKACDTSPTVAARVSAVDALHWLSAAMTSFCRGLNDTPKIVALGIGAWAALGLRGSGFYLPVALAMGAGSLLGGLRVTETLAQKVTPMAPGEGLAANLVTTLLVGLASIFALPVSTTHVSSGAIIGIGLHRGVETVSWKTVRDMLIAWAVTLPAAALVAGIVFSLLARGNG
ncbi:MAG: anion permease [Acidobacteriota bacterium]